MLLHHDALTKLIPIDLGPESDKDAAVEGGLLDQAMAAITAILPEAFPSTTSELLSRWEAEYALFPRDPADIAARLAALRAKYVNIGNLSKPYFKAIAMALGYDVEISEDGELYQPFRADISKADAPLYEAAAMWVWTVTTLNRRPGRDLIDTIADLNPPHMYLQVASVV